MSYLSILLLILGFVLLIKGADLLVQGASALGLRCGLSLFVVGLTIVAFGTSTPELVVNILASIKGEGSLVVGNILGSNIANILLVLGTTAAVSSISLSRSALRLDLPVSILGLVLFFLLLNKVTSPLEVENFSAGSTFTMSRRSGFLLLVMFFAYQFYLFKYKKAKEDEVHSQGMSIIRAIFYVVLGLAGLTWGGRLIVAEGKSIAVFLAETLGYESAEAIVGLTIVAIGTSLPEMVTSVVAVLKNKPDLAIGNVLGSNTFNILWVLGLSAAIKPLELNKSFYLEIMVILLGSLLLFLFTWLPKKGYLSVYQGYLMVIMYLTYLGHILFSF